MRTRVFAAVSVAALALAASASATAPAPSAAFLQRECINEMTLITACQCAAPLAQRRYATLSPERRYYEDKAVLAFQRHQVSELMLDLILAGGPISRQLLRCFPLPAAALPSQAGHGSNVQQVQAPYQG